MKRHAFQILLALSGGPLHGSAIARRVQEQTGGGVQLWPVTLHRTLDRLREEELIAELAGDDEHPEGVSKRRRYYRLTREGAAALTEEAERLRVLAAAARDNLVNQRWREP